MDDRLADIFDQCVTDLERGATVEACLAAYPQERADLEGPLRAAARLRGLPPPAALAPAVHTAIATQVLTHVAAQRVVPPPVPRVAAPPNWRTFDPGAALARVLRSLGYRGPLAQPWLRLGATAMALLLVLVLGTGAFAAARTVWNVIAPRPATLAPATTFTLNGLIEQSAAGSLVIDGITVDLDQRTVITGTPVVGTRAQARGAIRDDGTLLAQTVIVEAQAPPGTPPATAPPAPTAAPAPPTLPPPVATAAPAAPAPPPPLPPAAATPAPAAPAPAADPWAQLRQILEAGRADGRAGKEGEKLLKRLNDAQEAFAGGDRKKVGDRLRQLARDLQQDARHGKIDAGFARQALDAIGVIVTTYQLDLVPGNDPGNDKDKDKGNDKDKDKGKEKGKNKGGGND